MPKGHSETVMQGAPSEACAHTEPSQPNDHSSLLHEIPERAVRSFSLRQRSIADTAGEIPVFAEEESNGFSSEPSTCPYAECQKAYRHSFSGVEPSPSCTPDDSLLTTSSSTEHDNESEKPRETDVVQPQNALLTPPNHPAVPAEEPNPTCVSKPSLLRTYLPKETVSSVPICRICHDGKEKAPLASMCKCSGSVGLVHASCLERWINIRNADDCELCQHRFPTTTIDCSSQVRFFHWFLQNETQRQRAVLADLVLFMLMPLFAALGCYLLVHAASAQALRNHDWVSVSLVTLTGFLLTAFIALYMAWSYLVARLHYTSFRSWQSKNPMRRLLVVPPTVSSDASHSRPPEEVTCSEETADVGVESTCAEQQPTPLQREDV